VIKTIDSHIHFDDDRFDDDRDATYQRATQAGVCAMVLPAVHHDRWDKLFNLTLQYQNLFATAGLHPCYMQHHTEAHLAALDKTLATLNCVAVGECGLDGKINTDMEIQKHYFHKQLLLAAKHELPTIVHANGAVEDVISSIKNHGSNTLGVVHSYNGSIEQANRLIDMNYMLSFGGAVTFSRATRLRKLVKQIPLSSIMIETDAPDQPPHLDRNISTNANRKPRNEPAYLNKVLNAIAEIRNSNPQHIAEHSNANACELFKLNAKEIFQEDATT